MNRYELTYIIDTALEEEARKELIEKISQLIAANGGEVEKIDETWGKRRLAYAIKKAQKRANALQNIVIPGLNAEISRISDALEEKEREEFVRLKVVKAREDH